MCKRFIDTGLWKQSWFLELSPQLKLIWHYLTVNCNTAGIWRIDIRQLKKDTGLQNVDLDEAVKKINFDYEPHSGKETSVNRIMFIAEGRKLWITNYISFQNEKGKNGVNASIPAIKGAINRLNDEGMLDYAIKNNFVRVINFNDETVKNISGNAKDGNTAPVNSAADSTVINSYDNNKGFQPLQADRDKDKDKGMNACSSSSLKEEGGAGEETKTTEAGTINLGSEAGGVTKDAGEETKSSGFPKLESPTLQYFADKALEDDDSPYSPPGWCRLQSQDSQAEVSDNAGTSNNSTDNAVAKIYLECWGKLPRNSGEITSAEELLKAYGEDEFRFALKQANEHKKTTIAYIRGILRNRREKAAADKAKEEARRKAEETRRLAEEDKKQNKPWNLVKDVFGE